MWSSGGNLMQEKGAGIRPNTQQSWFVLSVPPLTVSPQPNPSILYFEKWYSATWAPKNCCFQTVVLEKTLESPLDCKEIKPANRKGNQSWILIGRTDAEAEIPILWPPDAKKWPWCWERLKAGRERDNRGWNGLMPLRTQWKWVRANSGRWWRPGKPGVLQSMGSQIAGHDWATKQQQSLCQSDFSRERANEEFCL